MHTGARSNQQVADLATKLTVYVSAAGSGDIHVLRPDQRASPTDHAEWQTVQRLTLGGAIMPMAFSPRRDRLYAVSRSAPFTVHSLAVDPGTGFLHPLGTSPLAGNMVYVSTSLDGRWLLTASYGEDRIAVNTIDAEGVAGSTVQVIDTPKQAHAICPSPDGQHVWVSCLGADTLLCHTLNASPPPLSAAPVLHHACRPGSGPRHLAFHPNGRWLFVVNELDGTVDALALAQGHDSAATPNPPNALTPIGHAPILPPNAVTTPWSAELRISTDGQWLFASDRRAATLSALRIDAHTGGLTLVNCVETEALPRSFAVSPDGLTLFVASQETGRLSILGFEPATGRMRLHGRLDCGTSPTWVEAIALPG